MNVRRLFTGLLTAAMASTMTGCVSYVRQGHVGLLVDDFSGEIKHVYDPGIRFATPLREHIIEFPMILQQYVMVRGGQPGDLGEDDAVRVNSLEGQNFVVDASVEFLIRSREDVIPFYQRYGLPFDTIIERYFRSRFKAALASAIASLPLNQAISGDGRRKVEMMALEHLRKTMNTDHIEIQAVLIRAVYLPDEISKAIADKTRAENDLERARTSARQRVVEAEARGRAVVVEAEAQAKATLLKAQAEAKANQEVAKSLTDRLIRKLYVEKLSDKLKLVLPPQGLYNLNDILLPEEKPAEGSPKR